MKEEIKEILDRAKKLKYKCDCCEEIAPGKYIMRNDKQTDNLIEAVYIIDKLLDYITNLQEENKELNDDNIWWNNRFKAVERDNRELKSRINKAVEFIEKELTFYITIGGTDERKLIGYNKAVDELLNILKGENNE